MKQSGASTENTSGQVPEHGLRSTSRAAPHANKQKPNSPCQNTTVPDSISHQCQTVLPHRHGSHHWITQKRWTRCHTNHSRPCSRAAIFLPCSTTITGAGIAQLYMEHLFQWFRLPQKIISDRDPHFTSHFARELTKGLEINQNLSTAFHPQTDGLSEQTNQWIEQYLHLITTNQNQWSKWLPLATAVHNNS
jgi:transposase InsO family protein